MVTVVVWIISTENENALFKDNVRIYIYDKKSFLAFTNKFSQLFTTEVREHQSSVTCFDLIRSHQTCILDGYMGEG